MLFKSYPTITRLIESRLTEVQDILRKVVFTDESIERDRQFVTYKNVTVIRSNQSLVGFMVVMIYHGSSCFSIK